MLISDTHNPQCQAAPLGQVPDPAFAKAADWVAEIQDRVCACAPDCPITTPVRTEIAPAVAAGAAEPLWRATLAHAQTALDCRRDCPAVDMLRAVLAATRLAYRAAG